MPKLSKLLVLILATPLIYTSSAYALETGNIASAHESAMLLESEKNTISIFKQSSPLVVSVDSTQWATDFFSMDFREVPAGSGTGFIWDNKGHVITNFHVIQNATRGSHIFVTTKDGKRYKAKIIGTEPRKDIAVLKVKEMEGQYDGFSNRTANSSQLLVGQKVLAIGSPFGFEQTLTQGIISALDRSMPSVFQQFTIRGMIQTDAPINPGNSGGPLISSQGQLVGMNTAIISGSGTSAGIGFAVPSNTIQRIANQIIKHGKVIQPGLGITYVPSYGKNLLKKYYGYDVEGVVVEKAGGNAKKAGIQGIEVRHNHVKLGDVIIKADNKEVKDIDDLYNILSEKQVGDKVKLDIKRNGRIITKTVPLQKLES